MIMATEDSDDYMGVVLTPLGQSPGFTARANFS